MICPEPAKERLYRYIGHKIPATNKAEYGDAIVLIQDSEGTEHLTQCGTAGSHIVDHKNVLLTDCDAKLGIKRFSSLSYRSPMTFQQLAQQRKDN